MNVLFKVCLIAIIAGCGQKLFDLLHQTGNIPEDATLNFTSIVLKYGHKIEEYDLTSEDGYIMKMYRIPGDKTQPVLLVHGIADCSDTFVIRGNTSLAVELARNNYDVWAFNYRGNRYSRRHVELDPDKDSDFWDYSLQEIAYYDIPLAVDFVLNATGQRQLSAIPYSQGTTTFYALGAIRPEYNDKIKISISLAPVSYIHNIGPILDTLVKLAPTLSNILRPLGIHKLRVYSPIKAFYEYVCCRNVAHNICMRYGLFPLAGAHPEWYEPEFVPVIFAHYPTSASVKNFLHLAQIGNSRRFGQFDYGEAGNLARYNAKAPPLYDLTKVTMNTALLVGNNDLISTVDNAALLRDRLPNVVAYEVLDGFSHNDYVWGKDSYKVLHPLLFQLLDKYK